MEADGNRTFQNAADLMRLAGPAFKTLFDNIYDAVLLHALDGRILAVNRKMLEMYRVTAGESCSFSIETDYSSEKNPHERLRATWDKVIAGENQFFDWTARRPHDGSTFDVEVFLCRLTLLGTDLILATVRDVSHSKEIERQLRSALAVRDEFLSVTSHELKTPLASLAMQVQLMVRKFRRETEALPEWSDRLLEGTLESVTRLSKLMDDLLDVSRMEQAKLSINPRKADLRSIVHQAIDKMSGALMQAKCDVRLEIPETIEGFWDCDRLTQALSNVISNSAKYAAGSKVTIRTLLRGPRARIEVEDGGSGIDVNSHPAIFDKFTRLQPQSHKKGLGLGLYIVRQIVEAHMGTVHVEQPAAGGSRFVIELPL